MNKGLQTLWVLIESEIKNLVANGKLETASELLAIATKIFSPSQHSEAIIIVGRAKKLQKEQTLGLLNYETLTEESNRVSLCILKFLESISPFIAAHSFQS